MVCGLLQVCSLYVSVLLILTVCHCSQRHRHCNDVLMLDPCMSMCTQTDWKLGHYACVVKLIVICAFVLWANKRSVLSSHNRLFSNQA